jgi:ketosteroid isomerase-like protein
VIRSGAGDEIMMTRDALGGAMKAEPTIVELVHAWFDAASRGDPAAIDRHLSTNANTRLVGSDPDEWLRGGEQIAAFLRGEVEGAAGTVTFAPSETEAFAVGDVGWAATKLTISLPDGKRVTPRWTAVFVRHDGDWQFVQTHASIAVQNDLVGWSYE